MVPQFVLQFSNRGLPRRVIDLASHMSPHRTLPALPDATLRVSRAQAPHLRLYAPALGSLISQASRNPRWMRWS